MNAFNLIVILLICYYTFRPINCSAIPDIPIVYFYKGRVPVHQWYTACVGLSHSNRVVLICDRQEPSCHKPDYLKELQIFYSDQYESEEYRRFVRVFQTFGGTGIVDLERIFVLAQWMKLNNVTTAFYGDSDAAVLARVGLHRRSHCDAQIHLALLENSEKPVTWMVWAGSSLTTLPLLQDFLAWTTELYSNPKYHHLLLKKQREYPNICDMSVWFLFVCTNRGHDEHVMLTTMNWDCPSTAELPAIKNSWLICDAQDDGFEPGRKVTKEHITFMQQGVHPTTHTPIMYAYYRSKISIHRPIFRLTSIHTHDKQTIPDFYPFCSPEHQRTLQSLG